jgi:UDP-3-O-[3-hydroxymyristoyl] N-acetylglucosamine deacetylase
VDGVGLHTGAPSRVWLRVSPGPVVLRVGNVEARLEELRVASTTRATTVEAHGGRLRVATVEHLFAALAALGVHDGLTVRVEGPEMPLLDGGSAAWCDAIDRLRPEATAPRLRVVREGSVEVGASRYEWFPGDRIAIDVRVDFDGFDGVRVAREVRWDGDAADFRVRIAPARTFAFMHDVTELLSAGLARHVDPASVLVLTPDGIHCAGRPYSADEPARHKLLDLVGDLYLHGGPPIGRVRAVRPGHAANHRALSLALAGGIVVSER